MAYISEHYLREIRAERDRLREVNAELIIALRGTLYLFERLASTKAHTEQIAFARAALARAMEAK